MEEKNKQTEQKQEKIKRLFPSMKIRAEMSESELLEFIDTEMVAGDQFEFGVDCGRETYQKFKQHVENRLGGGYEVSRLIKVSAGIKYIITVNRLC